MHDVVIVGAGPVGLTLGLGLARAGRSVLVLEKHPSTSEHSRAPAIWPRTQEILARLGVIERFLRDGIVLRDIVLRDARNDDALLHLPVSELAGSTDFPHLLILPQSRTERLLYEALRDQPAATVLFSAEVTGLSQSSASVEVTYRHEGHEKTAHGAYVAGCDGAHSTVRDRLGTQLEGVTYEVQAALADVILEGGRDYAFPRVSTKDGLAVGIKIDPEVWRLILPFTPGDDVPPLDSRIHRAVSHLFDGEPYRTLWKSEFRLHRRMSPTLVHGRVVLAGDAAHLNSPIGGQGMNAGMQDAEALTADLLRALEGDADALQLYAVRRRRQIKQGVNRFTNQLTRVLLVGGGTLLKPILRMASLILSIRPLRRRLLRRLAMLDQ